MQDGDVQPHVWSSWRCQWNKEGDAVLAKAQVGIALALALFKRGLGNLTRIARAVRIVIKQCDFHNLHHTPCGMWMMK